jgi:alkylated DNA repair dioxygenase AlkB
MQTLFPIEPQLPTGFAYLKNFISAAEEDELLRIIREIPVHPFHFQGYEAKRKVASFGYDWSFETQSLRKGKDIPVAFQWLIERIASFLNRKTEDFAELLLTEYPPGAVINWHRDAPPFDLIAGVSLHTDCLFRLRPYGKEKQGRTSVLSLPVQRRSLYVMEKEARTGWQHSIAAVKDTRYSITLRTLKH